MAFNQQRRLKLAAIVGAIPVVLFLIVATQADPDSRLPAIIGGLVLGVILFVIVAVTRPHKDDE